MAERGELFRFDDFLLNEQARTLDRLLPDGRTVPIQIGSRALQILCLLVDRRGQIITSSQIIDTVWPNVAVEQNNLTVQISALRRVLDAGRASGSCIQNISGRGYRLAPTVTEVSPACLGLPGTAPLTDGQVAAGSVEGDAAPGGQPEKGAARATVPAAALPSTTRATWRRGVWLALFVTCIATLTGAVLWSFGGLGTSRVAAVAPPSVSVPVDRPRLSFVVLPFRNLGGEGLDDATVDAITEDLTSDLSRGYGFFVIGRSSALTYKGKSVDLKRVGEEMGVRYAVEGSVRKIDGALLVNAQLASTETGHQIWSDRVGIARDGLSYNFDDLVRQIAHALFVNVVDVEGARSARERPANPDVVDLMLEARAVSQLPASPQRHSQRIALLEHAAELDPSSATVLASLAEALLDSIAFNSEDDPTVPGKLARVEGLVRAAESLQPSDKREKLVMFTRVYLLFKQSRCAEVIPAAQRTIVAQPNLISTSTFLGLCLMFDGRAAEAIPAYQHSIRLSPSRHPALHLRYRFVGYAQLFRGHYEEALVWFDKSLGANPSDNTRSLATTFAAIAAAQALSDEITKARVSGATATRLWPTVTARGYYPYRIASPLHAEQVEQLRRGLRLAGIRDHADENIDAEMASDDVLHSEYEAPTPTSMPGGRTIGTADLVTLLRRRQPLVLDVSNPWGSSIPGAIGLWGAGVGGSTSDEYQNRLHSKMMQLTNSDLNLPVVAMGWNAERFQGRNLALRLVALGYTNVYWYRGGREAWEAAGMPETEIALQEW